MDFSHLLDISSPIMVCTWIRKVVRPVVRIKLAGRRFPEKSCFSIQLVFKIQPIPGRVLFIWNKADCFVNMLYHLIAEKWGLVYKFQLQRKLSLAWRQILKSTSEYQKSTFSGAGAKEWGRGWFTGFRMMRYTGLDFPGLHGIRQWFANEWGKCFHSFKKAYLWS